MMQDGGVSVVNDIFVDMLLFEVVCDEFVKVVVEFEQGFLIFEYLLVLWECGEVLVVCCEEWLFGVKCCFDVVWVEVFDLEILGVQL